MTLSDWMKAKALGDGPVALRLGVTRVTISRIRRAKRMPSLQLMARIFELTEGAVTPSSFVDWGAGMASEADIDRECAE